MLDILICHAPSDRAAADAIASRLAACAEARPWLEECALPDRAIPEIWDRGLAGAAILLLLSPDSVRQRVQREEWAGLLEHFEGNESPPVACVRLAACAYPKILERRRFFPWNGDGFDTLREIERWVVGLHPPVAERLDVAPVPGFTGRDLEIDALFACLVDTPGRAALLNPEPASGKTALAQEFARRASRHFREIFWVDCGGRHPGAIHGDLCEQAGAGSFAGHRVLVVLDDVTGEEQIPALESSRASTLATSRSAKLRGGFREFHIDPAPLPEASPVDPGSTPGRLLAALHTCRPHGAALAIAARIAGLFEEEARAAVPALIEAFRVCPADLAGKRLRVTFPQPPDPALEAAHAEAVAEAIERWRIDGALAAAAFPEAERAVEWGLGNHWALAVRLSQSLFGYLRSRNRDEEARRVLERLAGAAEGRGDEAARRDAEWELSWFPNGGSGTPDRGRESNQQLALDFGW